MKEERGEEAVSWFNFPSVSFMVSLEHLHWFPLPRASFTFPNSVFAYCGGLNRNGSHKLMYLNMWSSGSVTI